MMESINIKAGLDIQDPPIIQDLLYFAEARFKLIVLAMSKVQNAPYDIQKWMQMYLRQELVSIVFIRTLSNIF